MAKDNPCDILTTDWNPVVGCQRYSPGCRDCWWFDGIMPWQKRLGNLPADLVEGTHKVLAPRLVADNLRPKKGIVGVIQHGDLFWDKISDTEISQVLEIVDAVAAERVTLNAARSAKNKPLDETKYVLWSKRAARMAEFMGRRYPKGVPNHIACGVSVENQALADARLPHLLKIQGHRFVMIEPMLGAIDLSSYAAVSWVVLGSETGHRARPMDLNWARAVRDFAVANRIPFFIKQVGTSHKSPDRILDGRTWDEFPIGFQK